MSKKRAIGLRVSVFSDSWFRGNPATVVVDDGHFDRRSKQLLAAEFGTSETVFISQTACGTYELRFFTPVIEVTSCAHATLAAAFAVDFFGMSTSSPTIEFKTAGGHVVVRRSENVPSRYELQRPIFNRLERSLSDRRLADILSVPASNLPNGMWIVGQNSSSARIMLELDKIDGFWEIFPDQVALKQFLKQSNFDGIFLFSSSDQAITSAYHGRYFAPAIGLEEDPVNGNSVVALAQLLLEQGRLVENELITVEQGRSLGRAGSIDAWYDPSQPGVVFLAGSVTPFSTFELF
jgi:trans-2,3-dihydro-3-hydroxyanthranilate isomerase